MAPTEPGQPADPQKLRAEAMHRLAQEGLMPGSLEDEDEILAIIDEAALGNQLTRKQKADLLWTVFGEVATHARRMARMKKCGESRSKIEKRTAGIAAAGELLGLTNDQSLTSRLGKKEAISDYQKAIYEHNSDWGRKKIRASVWHGSSFYPEVTDRNAIDHWWPAFLREVWRQLVIRVENGDLPAPTRAASESAPAPQPGYVHRKREEGEFYRLVADGAKLIAFVGQAGMGKTALARAVTNSAQFVRISNEMPHQGDLTALLTAKGLAARDWPTEPIERLASLTCGPDAPKFVGNSIGLPVVLIV